MKYSSAKISINSINFPLPFNLKSNFSSLFIGIEPEIFSGVFELFNKKDKSKLKKINYEF